MAFLGVNIDHVATLRQARRGFEPDALQAAIACETAGAHGITVHLREDARHIQKDDVLILQQRIRTRLNLEMALRKDIADFACELKPRAVCIVPENREEITTEGGLLVAGREKETALVVKRLQDAGIEVSLFIEADPKQIRASKETGASHIEIHTGSYANARTPELTRLELEKIFRGADLALELGLVVNAGHGLNYHNIQPLAKDARFHEFNIGHAIVSRAIFTGLETAVRDMLHLLGY